MDCDGVIFDANAFKLRALEATLADFPGSTHAAMVDYWKRSGGVSRYVKFDHYVREIVGLDGAEAEARIKATIATFAAHSRAGYAAVAPLPEALAFARAVGPQRLVVVSGTDGEELRQVFEQQGLTEVFPRVLGSPTLKREHIAAELAARGCQASECLFIGDGAGDLEAATLTGVPFFFLAQMSPWPGAREAIAATANASYLESWSELLSLASIA